ncbi:unnamed protein product [Anisakis simplex]|uniref:Gamma-glutamylcyclotransferase n=1 Tax=Anisakis simplex TaxID=6269 RepID=A0A0M3JNW9_ANISI|nr:unnamed protein product [Anisakis simplex]
MSIFGGIVILEEICSFPGYIFIAGRSDRMPEEVMAQLKEIVSERGLDADAYFRQLEAKGRVQFETWG